MERMLKSLAEEGLTQMMGDEADKARHRFGELQGPYEDYSKMAEAMDLRVNSARKRMRQAVMKAIALDAESGLDPDAMAAFDALQMNALGTHGLIISTINQLRTLHTETHKKLKKDYGFSYHDNPAESADSEELLHPADRTQTVVMGPDHLRKVVDALSAFKEMEDKKVTMTDCLKRLHSMVVGLQMAQGLFDCDIESISNYMTYRTKTLKDEGIQAIANLESSVADLEKSVHKWDQKL